MSKRAHLLNIVETSGQAFNSTQSPQLLHRRARYHLRIVGIELANTIGVDSYQQDECGLHRIEIGSHFDIVTVLVPVLTDKWSPYLEHQIQPHHHLWDVDLDSGWAETPVSRGGNSALAASSAPSA